MFPKSRYFAQGINIAYAFIMKINGVNHEINKFTFIQQLFAKLSLFK